MQGDPSRGSLFLPIQPRTQSASVRFAKLQCTPSETSVRKNARVWRNYLTEERFELVSIHKMRLHLLLLCSTSVYIYTRNYWAEARQPWPSRALSGNLACPAPDVIFGNPQKKLEEEDIRGKTIFRHYPHPQNEELFFCEEKRKKSEMDPTRQLPHGQ